MQTIMLACPACGGPAKCHGDIYSDGSTAFTCKDCGQRFAVLGERNEVKLPGLLENHYRDAEEIAELDAFIADAIEPLDNPDTAFRVEYKRPTPPSPPDE